MLFRSADGVLGGVTGADGVLGELGGVTGFHDALGGVAGGLGGVTGDFVGFFVDTLVGAAVFLHFFGKMIRRRRPHLLLRNN